MSHVTFDIQWKEAMQELAKLTDDEIPSDASLTPKTLAQYSCLYVRYLQVYKKLEECCDQIVHSQKRIEAKKALEACIGRMLEIRSWLVTLNEGRDFVNFDATLVCLNVGPEVLDVLPPRNLIDDNATSLETREKFLLKLIEMNEIGLEKAQDDRPTFNLSEEEAIMILQANERGRQGRQKIVELTKTRQMQEEALRHQQSGGESMSHEAAAIIMQSAARSFLARCRIKKSEDDELTLIACRATGAAFINLSPSNTDDKYPGKQAGRMLQMAFKVAKIMAPSIVYVSEVEKIFVTDKKKLKTFGFKDKCNRIKKSLIKEVEVLKPGDRVLILGTSSQPQDAPSKPPAFFNLFTKRIYIPYPDYSSRMTLWRTMIEKKGGVLTNKFNLSTLAHISSGYSNGIIDKVCAITITEKRKRKLRRFPLLIDELTYHLYRSKPVDPICLQTLLEWGKPSQELEEPLKGKLGAKTKGSGKIDVKR